MNSDFQKRNARAEENAKAAAGINANGAALTGDSRDLFRPKTSDIPREPGVYKWRDENGRVIYVGKAKNLRNRLTSYFQPLQNLHPRTRKMVLTARSLEWTIVKTELESLTLEYLWIKEFNPRFNIIMRDDKTYPYLAVSAKDEYPRVWITRSRKPGKIKYFGPYAKVWDMRNTLDGLLRAYPVRTCNDNKFNQAQKTSRPCLLASIGKCSAPCAGKISKEEHRQLCEQITGVLTGRLGKKYRSDLQHQMQEASDNLEFEKAARLRDRIRCFDAAIQYNAAVLSSEIDADIFAMASDELEASVHAFFIRGGIIRGERNWSVERINDISDSELMRDLLEMIYSQILEENKSTPANNSKIARKRRARQTETGRFDFFSPVSPIPGEIILQIEPDGKENIEKHLSQIRKGKVSIKVPERGEKNELAKRAFDNALLALKQNKNSRVNSLQTRTAALNELKKALGLSSAPLRIECYDISNSAAGDAQVGSMIVFEDGLARKSEYRKFAVQGKNGEGKADDLSALREVLVRRFDRKNDDSQNETSKHFAYRPDLVVIDGGRLQAITAAKALKDCGQTNISVCALAKKMEEIWLPDDDYPIILKRQSEGMYLIQRIRDESHRYAIEFHRKKRVKNALKSELDGIDGIGPEYQKKLLKHFGSVRRIKNASEEELKEVKGIGSKKAHRIFLKLHENKNETKQEKT